VSELFEQTTGLIAELRSLLSFLGFLTLGLGISLALLLRSIELYFYARTRQIEHLMEIHDGDDVRQWITQRRRERAA
jgi:hypothetical protein